MDYINWIDNLRDHPNVLKKGATKSDPFEIEAVAATKELPFKAISKCVYGETLTDEVSETLHYPLQRLISGHSVVCTPMEPSSRSRSSHGCSNYE